MNLHNETFSKHEDPMTKAELNENILQRIYILEQELKKLNEIDENKWISLKEAAIRLCKSPAAIRQKVKNPDNMMAKNVVWKQKTKGAEILINLQKYRRFL
ncbi:hypothetical protein [Aliiglaciecola sp. NS0011-25]|uniref:hypothetical protein n=1 Tax=Aliiglaciecola sp. NS0011-25 TaxID=3127654 RepID=UPI0031095495